MAELASWKPIHSAHAIQLAAVNFTFHEQIGDVALRRTIAEIEPIAKSLGLSETAPIGMMLPAELLNLGLQTSQQHGLLFFRRESDGTVGERLHVTRDLLRFEDFSYIRWSPFKSRARSLIEAALVRYADIASIANAASEYVDVFFARNPDEKPNVSEVINPLSGLVAPRAFRPLQPWHCHTGWFADDAPGDGRIVNLNLDVNDPEIDGRETRTLRILSRVTDVYSQGDPNGRWNPASYFDEPIESAHQILKGLLREVLSPAASNEISLG